MRPQAAILSATSRILRMIIIITAPPSVPAALCPAPQNIIESNNRKHNTPAYTCLAPVWPESAPVAQGQAELGPGPALSRPLESHDRGQTPGESTVRAGGTMSLIPEQRREGERDP